MLNDAHFHVGQFYDIYTSPIDILHYMDKVKIERVAISSTTICEGDYGKVLREMFELIELGDNRIVPILWITVAMLDSGELLQFLDRGINWRAIKIHRQTGWSTHFDDEIMPCLTLAKKLNIPILFHTGESFGCNAGSFENIIQQNSNQRFILAHAKPIDQTRRLMLKYPNVWCDTSFQIAENIVQLIDSGLADRILWGSDYPIPRHYYRTSNMIQYYNTELNELKCRISDDNYHKLSCKNFQRLWT